MNTWQNIDFDLDDQNSVNESDNYFSQPDDLSIGHYFNDGYSFHSDDFKNESFDAFSENQVPVERQDTEVLSKKRKVQPSTESNTSSKQYMDEVENQTGSRPSEYAKSKQKALLMLQKRREALDNPNLSAKEKKKIRNQIAAQESRDKKKYELDYYREENIILKRKIEEYQEKLRNQVCTRCSSREVTVREVSSGSSNGSRSLIGGIFVLCLLVLCIFGSRQVSNDTESTRSAYFDKVPRNLIEVQEQVPSAVFSNKTKIDLLGLEDQLTDFVE